MQHITSNMYLLFKYILYLLIVNKLFKNSRSRSLSHSGAATGFQSGGGRDFLGTKLFPELGTKFKKKGTKPT